MAADPPSRPVHPRTTHGPAKSRAGGEAAARLKPVDHKGPLPWVQLRNVSFHPTVYRKMIGAIDGKAQNGDLVKVYDRDGELFGTGLFSRNAVMGVRMVTFDASPFDEAALEERLRRAVELRQAVLKLDVEATAYRLVHAEGDGLPGLIVDRLGDFAVVELFSFPMYRRMEAIRRVLTSFPMIKEVIFRADERMQDLEGFALTDAAPQGAKSQRSADRRSTIVTENGLRFQIDLTHGHKTGFFCDHRENRMALTQYTPGLDVLDMCAYSGGFGIYAATIGKAKSVTCVDLDEDAIALAQRNANLNKVPKEQFQTAHADAFVHFRHLQTTGKTFDAVILDPPKLIRSVEEQDEGRIKYLDLNRLAMLVIRPGGVLVTCSCSGLLSAEEFFNILRQAGRSARRRVQTLRMTGPGPDHPVMTDCPETAYLKCVWARIW